MQEFQVVGIDISICYLTPTIWLVQLFSACNDGSIRVWNLERKNWSKELDKKHLSAVTSLSVSGDGGTLISAGRDKASFNIMSTFSQLFCLTAVSTKCFYFTPLNNQTIEQ